MQPSYYQPTEPPKKRGMPAWGWILLGCACLPILFIPILAAILFPVFAQARAKARSTACYSNMRQINLGIQMYIQDYDQKLPPARDWMATNFPYVKNKQAYHCPSVRSSGADSYGYAYNINLSGKPLSAIENPARTVDIYDSDNLAYNASDKISSLPNPGRHLRYNNFGCLDGLVTNTRNSSDILKTP